MTHMELSRRDFLRVGVGAALGAATGSRAPGKAGWLLIPERTVVSVVKIQNDKTSFAVEKAIDLLGGIENVARGKERIMVAARVMGFKAHEIPAFTVAQSAGMNPSGLDEIEVRGEKISNVWREFKRPDVVTRESINYFWGGERDAVIGTTMEGLRIGREHSMFSTTSGVPA